MRVKETARTDTIHEEGDKSRCIVAPRSLVRGRSIDRSHAGDVRSSIDQRAVQPPCVRATAGLTAARMSLAPLHRTRHALTVRLGRPCAAQE
jgi:hypothetical protein